MINRKALMSFLAMTFIMTMALVAGARSMGFSLVGAPDIMSQLVIAACMFIPATSAIITQVFIVRKPLKELGFRLGPVSTYIKSYLLILIMFTINYAIVWAFVVEPDFTLQSFIRQFEGIGDVPLPMDAGAMVALLTVVTLIGAPILNLIPSLGEEIGWRGFLMPALEPLGKVRSMVMTGMIWALWHTPMILILGFGYGAQAWPGVLLHFVTVTGIGIWMGYVWLKTRSVILAGFIHATFNAHAYGVWSVLFVSDGKLVVGAAGFIGAILCIFLGAYFILRARREELLGRL